MRPAALWLTTAVLLCSPVAVAAQVKAYTGRISADRIVLDVKIAGRSSATIQVRNGEMARVTPNGSTAIGLTPVLKNGNLQLVVLQVLVDPATGNEGLQQLSRRELARGAITILPEVAPALEVTWIDTLPPATSTPEVNGPCFTCCVTCGDATYCGCVVIAECGRCCCPTACICPFEPQVGRPETGGCRTLTSRPKPGTPRQHLR